MLNFDYNFAPPPKKKITLCEKKKFPALKYLRLSKISG